MLGVRLGAAGHPLATAMLAGLAAVVWLALTYGVPASLLLTRERDSVLGGVNGTWLLWVVGTQSLSVAAAALVPVWPSQSRLLAPTAVGLWSVGLVLYLLLVALILLRWLTVAMTPATLGPPYWILMGATAITVLAGARILNLPAALPVTRATAGFVEGFSFTLWAFGTWWIPLLIVLGLWRHVRRHWPFSYEPTLWSVVFPLGMYSVATLSFGEIAHLSFMEPLSRFMLWVAVAAWVVVAVAFLARLARRSGEPASATPAASASAADHGDMTETPSPPRRSRPVLIPRSTQQPQPVMEHREGSERRRAGRRAGGRKLLPNTRRPPLPPAAAVARCSQRQSERPRTCRPAMHTPGGDTNSEHSAE